MWVKKTKLGQTISELLTIAPQLRISPLSFIVPLCCTIVAVFCDGAALALLSPLLQRVIEETASVANPSQNVNRVIGMILRILHLSWESSITSLVLAVLFLSIIAIPLRKLAAMRVEKTAKILNSKLQPVLIGRILSYGKLYFKLSDLSVVNEARAQATTFLTFGLRLLFRSIEALAFVLFYLCIMFSISWLLSIYFLFAACFMVIITRSFRRKVESLTVKEIHLSQMLRRQIATGFQGIEVVKGNALEVPISQKISKRAEEKNKIELEITELNFYSAIAQDILGVVIVFAAVALYIYSVPQISSAVASNAAVFLVLARRILQPISVISASFLEVARIAPGRESLRCIFAEEDKFIPYSGTISPPESMPDIVIKDLSFTYPNGHNALRDICIDLVAGSTTVIVGRSGAGKTTLMNLLLKSFELPANSIFLGNTDLREIDRVKWCRSVAYVPQNTTLFTGSLRENLSLSLSTEPSDAQLLTALEKVSLGYLPERIDGGLDGLLGDKATSLSRGEQQLISIARVILQNPKLVLIDEATASLDVATECKLMETLYEFCKTRTALLITHRLSTIRGADMILVIENSQLVERGNFKHLLNQGGVFSSLWKQHLASENLHFD